MIILTLSCVFYKVFHPFLINLFANRFNVVSNKDNLLVHFINVGQGDAVAINLPDGKVVLIDSGMEEVNTDYINYLKENVVNSNKNKFIDYLILSHADMDHIGGTLKLLRTFDVGMVYMPLLPSDSNGYAEILNYVDLNCANQTLDNEQHISNGEYSIKFFEIINNDNTNDSSQLIKLEYRSFSFLFVGDISSNVELDYVAQYGEDLNCDVLKVSHHGSNTASSEEFLEVVTPNYAIISVGKENNYGHPNSEVLNRLNNVEAKVLRTDKNGDILFVVGNNYNLFEIHGSFYITSLSLNYVDFVILIDGVLVVVLILIICKKEKRKRSHK